MYLCVMRQKRDYIGPGVQLQSTNKVQNHEAIKHQTKPSNRQNKTILTELTHKNHKKIKIVHHHITVDEKVIGTRDIV
jgi:hypothetical protein